MKNFFKAFIQSFVQSLADEIEIPKMLELEQEVLRLEHKNNELKIKNKNQQQTIETFRSIINTAHLEGSIDLESTILYKDNKEFITKFYTDSNNKLH